MNIFQAIFLSLITLSAGCGSPFLKKVKDIGAQVSCSALELKAPLLAADIARHDIGHLPFWQDGGPIPLVDQRDYCIEEIKKTGFVIFEKPWAGKDHFSTTIPLPMLQKIPGWERIRGIEIVQTLENVRGIVLYRNGLMEAPMLWQAASFCHEMVHAKTEARLGILQSGVAYAVASTRAGFEYAPYGVTLAIHYLNGQSPELIELKAHGIIDSLHENYLLQTIPKECLHDVAVEFWRTAPWLAPRLLRSDVAITGG